MKKILSQWIKKIFAIARLQSSLSVNYLTTLTSGLAATCLSPSFRTMLRVQIQSFSEFFPKSVYCSRRLIQSQFIDLAWTTLTLTFDKWYWAVDLMNPWFQRDISNSWVPDSIKNLPLTAEMNMLKSIVRISSQLDSAICSMSDLESRSQLRWFQNIWLFIAWILV